MKIKILRIVVFLSMVIYAPAQASFTFENQTSFFIISYLPERAFEKDKDGNIIYDKINDKVEPIKITHGESIKIDSKERVLFFATRYTKSATPGWRKSAKGIPIGTTKFFPFDLPVLVLNYDSLLALIDPAMVYGKHLVATDDLAAGQIDLREKGQADLLPYIDTKTGQGLTSTPFSTQEPGASLILDKEEKGSTSSSSSSSSASGTSEAKAAESKEIKEEIGRGPKGLSGSIEELKRKSLKEAICIMQQSFTQSYPLLIKTTEGAQIIKNLANLLADSDNSEISTDFISSALNEVQNEINKLTLGSLYAKLLRQATKDASESSSSSRSTASYGASSSSSSSSKTKAKKKRKKKKK